MDQQREAHQVHGYILYVMLYSMRWEWEKYFSIHIHIMQKIKKFVWERGVLVLCFCNEFYSVYADDVCRVIRTS